MNEKELKADIAKLTDRIPDFYFTGEVDENRIKQAEKVLGVNFPESYKWFLRSYGTSASIYGIGLSETPAVVKYTLNYRKFGLPKSLVVIKDVGEWVYCLDTGRMKNNEAL